MPQTENLCVVSDLNSSVLKKSPDRWYHGTTDDLSFDRLAAGSWITTNPHEALIYSKVRSDDRNAKGILLLVSPATVIEKFRPDNTTVNGILEHDEVVLKRWTMLELYPILPARWQNILAAQVIDVTSLFKE